MSSRRKDKESDQIHMLKNDKPGIQPDKSMLLVPVLQMLCMLRVGDDVKKAKTKMSLRWAMDEFNKEIKKYLKKKFPRKMVQGAGGQKQSDKGGADHRRLITRVWAH